MSEHVSSRGLYGEMDPVEVRRNLIREMNRLSVVRLDGTYSGGHDEGGLDDLTLYGKDGKPLEGNLSYDHPLHQAVEDLLTTKFYSWALGMSVYGHVYVDLKEKRAWTEGEEETTEYVPDTDPIDMSW